MAQENYIVEGRQFRTERDYKLALKDHDKISALKEKIDFHNKRQLELLIEELNQGKIHFNTMLGEDFKEEAEEKLRMLDSGGQSQGQPGKIFVRGNLRLGKKAKTAPLNTQPSLNRKAPEDKKLADNTKAPVNAKRSDNMKLPGNTKVSDNTIKTKNTLKGKDTKKSDNTRNELENEVKEEIKKQERRRKWIVFGCSIAAAACLGYFFIYSYYDYKTEQKNSQLSAMKDSSPGQVNGSGGPPLIHYTGKDKETPEVLDEYKNLVNQNKKLIGWLKIDDTNIDYPVMQTTNNEYYLDHNLNQEYDKNGSIFLDKDCDVIKPSTNFILYGHNMKSGQMFGKLEAYSSEDYFKDHRYIQFDSIYQKGTYEVMYVFRSRIYREEEIVFKYYQFIDAISEQEFDSYMEEMKAISMYDTGVTAQWGDQLLTLSTCDYSEKDGRFVVVAKKID